MSDRASLATAADADREMNRWLGPLFVAMIFAFTSIAVVNTLVMIALRRGRELALLRLVGAHSTPGALDGALGSRPDHRDRASASVWRSQPPRCCRSATRSPAASDHTCRPARSRRSSASRPCWRYWPWRCPHAGRCTPDQSRRSEWASRSGSEFEARPRPEDAISPVDSRTPQRRRKGHVTQADEVPELP